MTISAKYLPLLLLAALGLFRPPAASGEYIVLYPNSRTEWQVYHHHNVTWYAQSQMPWRYQKDDNAFREQKGDDGQHDSATSSVSASTTTAVNETSTLVTYTASAESISTAENATSTTSADTGANRTLGTAGSADPTSGSGTDVYSSSTSATETTAGSTTTTSVDSSATSTDDTAVGASSTAADSITSTGSLAPTNTRRTADTNETMIRLYSDGADTWLYLAKDFDPAVGRVLVQVPSVLENDNYTIGLIPGDGHKYLSDSFAISWNASSSNSSAS